MYLPLKRLTICIDKVGVKNNMPYLVINLTTTILAPLKSFIWFSFHFPG